MRNELIAGALLALAARGPWVTPSWRHSLAGRLALAIVPSLAYEYIVEPVNHQTNAGRASDVGQRLAGTIGVELVLVIGH